MNAILDSINYFSTLWWTYAWHSTWQSVLVGGVLLAVVYLGRRWPAPLRCGLLLLALAKFAVPPMLSIPTGLFGLAGPTLANPRGATPESIQRAEVEPFRAPESMPYRSIPQRQQPFSTGSPDELAATNHLKWNSPSAEPTPAGGSAIGWKSVLILHLAGSLVALVGLLIYGRGCGRPFDRLSESSPAPPISLRRGRARLSSARRSRCTKWTARWDNAPTQHRFRGIRTAPSGFCLGALAGQVLKWPATGRATVAAFDDLRAGRDANRLGLLRPTIILPLAVVERLPVAKSEPSWHGSRIFEGRFVGERAAIAPRHLVVQSVLGCSRALRSVRNCCDDLLLTAA